MLRAEYLMAVCFGMLPKKTSAMLYVYLNDISYSYLSHRKKKPVCFKFGFTIFE